MPFLKSLLLLLANFLVLITMFIFARNVLLTFNKQLFYILANILAYIGDYSKSKQYISLYINIIE